MVSTARYDVLLKVSRMLAATHNAFPDDKELIRNGVQTLYAWGKGDKNKRKIMKGFAEKLQPNLQISLHLHF